MQLAPRVVDGDVVRICPGSVQRIPYGIQSADEAGDGACSLREFERTTARERIQVYMKRAFGGSPASLQVGREPVSGHEHGHRQVNRVQSEHCPAVLSGDDTFSGPTRKQRQDVGAGDRPTSRENRDDRAAVGCARRTQHPPGNQPRFRALLNSGQFKIRF